MANETAFILRWWCILTNLICLFPAKKAIQKNKYVESTLWILSGGFSLWYHVLDTRDSNSDVYQILRFLDYLYADLTIFSTATLLFLPHTNLRHISLFPVASIQVFLISLQFSLYERFTSMFTSFLFLRAIYEYFLKDKSIEKYDGYNWRWIGTGVAVNGIGFLFYRPLAELLPNLYNLWHGIHHIFGYGAIVCYLYGVKWPRFPRVASESDIWAGDEEAITPIQTPRMTTPKGLTSRHSSSRIQNLV